MGYKEITQEQLQQGYLEKIGNLIYHREFRIMFRTAQGTYVVQWPDNEWIGIKHAKTCEICKKSATGNE